MLMRRTGTIGICIDEYQNDGMSGRIVHAGNTKGEQFNGVLMLVKRLNEIFDEGDYPQATMKCRGFGKRSAQEKGQRSREQAKEQAGSLPTDMKGSEATFSINVLFRQNASWQGEITWEEGGMTESFNSELEMMMLIDSALSLGREAPGFAERAASGV